MKFKHYAQVFMLFWAFLLGWYVARKLFPQVEVREVPTVVEHEVVKLDTVRVFRFVEKAKPEKIVISPQLQPPEVIFHSYDVTGLWKVKCTSKKLEAWGFKIENDSVRTFYQSWKLKQPREWVLQPSFSSGGSYYTLKVKKVSLRRFCGLGMEYSGQFNPYLRLGIGINQLDIYARADLQGLKLGFELHF